MESIGAFFICLWVLLIVGLVISFVASYFFTANTTIYFLMRKKVDKTDYNDIYLEEDVEELVTNAQPESKVESDQPVDPQPQSGSQTEKQENEPEKDEESEPIP